MKQLSRKLLIMLIICALLCPVTDMFSGNLGRIRPASAADTTAYRIMPLGDSITAGYCPGSAYEFGGYRMYLASLLEENGLSGQFDFVGKWNTGVGYDMDNNGTNGVMISNNEWGDSIKKDVVTNGILKTYQPDMILLQIGTNDILGQSEKKELREFSKINERLEDLINVITENAKENAVIFLASIPYMEGSSYEKYNTNVDSYNFYIRKLVKQRQALQQNIYFVDINSAVAPGQYVDGVHPDQDGYESMGKLWYKTLTGYLYDPDTFLKEQEELLSVPEPTITPTLTPTTTPSATPTAVPTPVPTLQPSLQPSASAMPLTPEQTAAPASTDMVKKGTQYTRDGLTYKVTSIGKTNSVQLIKANAPARKQKHIVIPDKITINGSDFYVTSIGKNVFKKSKVQKMVLGKNIRSLQKGALANCSSLKQLRFKGSVWTTAAAGSGAKTTGVTFIIPKKQKTRYQTLIKKAGFKKFRITYSS